MEACLHDPAFFATRSREAPAVLAELDVSKAEVARLYARWEELDQIAREATPSRVSP